LPCGCASSPSSGLGFLVRFPTPPILVGQPYALLFLIRASPTKTYSCAAD
jgi:hypothetical protein